MARVEEENKMLKCRNPYACSVECVGDAFSSTPFTAHRRLGRLSCVSGHGYSFLFIWIKARKSAAVKTGLEVFPELPSKGKSRTKPHRQKIVMRG